MSYRRACVIDLFPIGGFEAGSVLIYPCKQCGQKCPADDSIEVCSASRVTVAIGAELSGGPCASLDCPHIRHTYGAGFAQVPAQPRCLHQGLNRPTSPATYRLAHSLYYPALQTQTAFFGIPPILQSPPGIPI